MMSRFVPSSIRIALFASLLLASVAGAQTPPERAAPAKPPEITVYAAASLRDVLAEIAPVCETAAGVKLVFNFGGSNDLARQIVAANKADVFISADEGWMNHVAEAKLVDTQSRRRLLSNALVVVAASDTQLVARSARDLASLPVKWISLANPDAVPAGKYAKAWLAKAGTWEQVKDRVLPAPDVRAAMAAVEKGAAEVGVVYRTDAKLSKSLRVVHEVSEAESDVHIVYPIAALADRPNLEPARRVVECLCDAKARAVFERAGFLVIGGP